jgi:hypothetical protein
MIPMRPEKRQKIEALMQELIQLCRDAVAADRLEASLARPALLPFSPPVTMKTIIED